MKDQAAATDRLARVLEFLAEMRRYSLEEVPGTRKSLACILHSSRGSNWKREGQKMGEVKEVFRSKSRSISKQCSGPV